MAKRLITNAEVRALFATTVGNLKPYQLEQLMDALHRTNYDRGTGDTPTQPTLDTIFPSGGPNP